MGTHVVLIENGKSIRCQVRLKIAAGKISEIDGGQIHAVEAFMHTAPLGTAFAWDDLKPRVIS